MVYLDHNATSPLLPEARDAMVEALDHAWANPHSPHRLGQAAAAAMDQARRQVAKLVGRDPRELVFTSGATEANAMALAGLTSEQRPEVWVSAVEHPSVLAWGTRLLLVDGWGRVCLDGLEAMLDRGADRVAVISVMAANNETGVIQPVAEVSALCRRFGVLFHCDATQLVGRLPARIDADLMSLSAHKMGGPRGAGALVTRARPRPLLRGGPQERNRRAGTPNVAAIVGFGVAAGMAAGRASASSDGRDRLEAACRTLGATILGLGAPRLPNTVSALFPWAGDLIVAALDLEGVACSTGSACASGASEPSHVVAAMGHAGIPVRFSLGRDTDVQPAIQALNRVIPRLERACASS